MSINKTTELTAGQYNAKAREEGRDDWNTAYRKDILGINDSNNNQNNNSKPNNINNQNNNITETPFNNSNEVKDETPKYRTPSAEEINFYSEDSKKYGGFQSEEYKNKINNELGEGAYDSIYNGTVEAKKNNRLKKEEEDFSNWNVDYWKTEKNSDINNFIDAVEKKYSTVLDTRKGDDGKEYYTGTVGNDIYEWWIDEEGNPRKKKIGSVDEEDKIKNGFVDLINAGASMEELNKYILNNPKHRGAMDAFLKSHIKLKDENNFLSLYGGLSNDELFDEVSKGNIVIGSNKYNLLPEERRKEFEAWKEEKDTALTFEKVNFDGLNNVLNFDNLASQIQTFFNSSVKEKHEKLLQDPELKRSENRSYDLQRQIEDLDNQIEEIAEKLPKDMPGTPDYIVNAEIAVKQEALYKKRNSLVKELGIVSAKIQNMKDDIKYNLELAKYDDQQRKDAFMFTLNQYNNERARMDKFAIMKLEEESKILAENRAREFQLKIKEIEQKFQEEQAQKNKEWEAAKITESREYESKKITEAREYESKNKKGVYQTDRDGNLLYVIDGVAQKVIDNVNGQVVGITKEKGYTESISKNELGGWDVLRIYDDGRVPEMFSYGVDGKTKNGTSLYVWNALGKMPEVGKYFGGQAGKLQCGEAANIYLKNIGVSNINMGHTYESKKKHINSQSPQIGGLAVWNPSGASKENGHVGIVTGYNASSGEIEITDWNSKGDGIRDTYKIQASQILNSDGGFVHINSSGFGGSNDGYYNNDLVPFFGKFYGKDGKSQMTTADWKIVADMGISEQEFARQAGNYKTDYQAEINKAGQDEINSIISIAENLRDTTANRYTTEVWAIPGTKGYDLKSDFDVLISKLALENLIDLKNRGATFGALSDNELNFIRSAATGLKLGMSKDKWEKTLNSIINKLKKGVLDNHELQSLNTISDSSLLEEFESSNGNISYSNKYQSILNH